MTQDLETGLRPLCHVSYELADPIVVSQGPEGSRIIGEITGAQVEGERLRASLYGRAAADWAFVQPSGRVLADVRVTLQTDDGATIWLTYKGLADIASGRVRSAMFFETGDERYTWLTRILAVAAGHFDGSKLDYEVYEVT